MDLALAHHEIRIAAKWWRNLLVCRHDEVLPAVLFALHPEHVPIRPERANAFQVALVVEIEKTFGMDFVLWGAADPSSGEGLRKLEVVGTRAPSEVVRAADLAGLAYALRHLPDGAETAINPGSVDSDAGRRAGPETTEVAALSRGGAS